jgi:uncharacterized protein (DUF1800 family)
MNPTCLFPWVLGVFSWMSVCLPVSAGDPNPLPPTVTSITLEPDNQLKVQWTPVPGAEEFKLYSTSDLFSPFTENNTGTILGYDWTGPLAGPAGFHRVGVTTLSSNALLSATVLSRLTYGPTPGDIARIATIGPQAYIDEQLAAETIAEDLDTAPPIVNLPPSPPPLTNWTRQTVTGTSSGTNFGIYLSARGSVYLDDIRVVLGTNADTGPNLLANGSFEDPTMFAGWILGSTVMASVVTNSPTTGGLAAEGNQCLRLVATAATTTLTAGLWQPYATNPPPSNQRFTLSFSYLPVENTSNTMLTVRLSGSSASRSVELPPAPPAPPAPPTAISPTYTRLTETTASLHDLRAYHVLHAVQSQRQLYELLVQFFENHFTTEYQKTKEWFDNNYARAITNGTTRERLAVDLEWREYRKWRQLLLDPNCTFHDLLKVSVESPAMIIYLDTILSTRTAANENYARELLELHTFGADNGYTQQDIVELAKIWTGWSVAKKDPSVAHDPFAPPVSDPTNSAGIFSLHFRTNTHNIASTKRLFTNTVIDPRFGSAFRGGQPYSLIISNNAYPGTNGMREGYLVIDHLANLPYTMEFVSVKLCRTFVHEEFEFGIYDYTDPNLSAEAALVRDCMTAWETPAADGRKGNLRSVLRTIFASDLFRGHAASRQKIKTPLEYAVSAVRALRTIRTTPEGYITPTSDTDGYGLSGTANNTSPLSRMGGMALFNKAEPDGYSEYGRIWMNTANLCERMRYVEHLCMLTSSSTKDDDYGAPGLRNTSDPVAVLRAQLENASQSDAGAVVDVFLGTLFPGEGRANLALDRAAAIGFLDTNEAGAPSAFSELSVGSTAYEGRVRGMVAFLMSLPRFQEQ